MSDANAARVYHVPAAEMYDEPHPGWKTWLGDHGMAQIAAKFDRQQRRLEFQGEQHRHWRERAIAAEQVLGLYGSASHA